MIPIVKNHAEYRKMNFKHGQVFIYNYRHLDKETPFPFRVEIDGVKVVALFADIDDATQYAEWLQQQRTGA